jgi:predicted MFS family arabinose efflux permease
VLTRAARHRGVLLICAITVLLAFGQFVAFTYLAPLVRAHTGLSGTGLAAVLLAYGAAGVFGVVRVGKIADRRPRLGLLVCCASVVAGLTLIVAVPHGTAAMVLAILAWGAGFTALPICLQSAVLRIAPEIPDTASSLYVVAFQIGIGGGSLAGAGLLGAHDLGAIPDLSLALFLLGSILAATARATFGGDPSRPTTDAGSLTRRRTPGARSAAPVFPVRPSIVRACRPRRPRPRRVRR